MRYCLFAATENTLDQESQMKFLWSYPSLCVIFIFIGWELSRNYRKQSLIKFCESFIVRFTGYRFTKEYQEVILVVGPPMLAIIMTFIRSIPSLEALSELNFEKKECTRIVIHGGCYAICYTLCRVWLDLMHATYRYFERQTKILDLFTKRSTATQWHYFKRDYKEMTSSNDGNSILRDTLREVPSFDLCVLKHLVSWSQTRDVIASDWSSAETNIRQANIQFIVAQTIVLLLATLIHFFLNISTPAEKDNMQGFAKTLLNASPGTYHQTLLLLTLCGMTVIPILYTRFSLSLLQNHHIKLIERMQHRVEIMDLNKMLSKHEENEDKRKQTGEEEDSPRKRSKTPARSGRIRSSPSSSSSSLSNSPARRSSARRSSARRLTPPGSNYKNWWERIDQNLLYASSVTEMSKSEKNIESTKDALETFSRKMKESDVKPTVFWGMSIESVLPKISFIFISLFTWWFQSWSEL
jgi:hypothetical protein